jgi:hypothetical protein
MADHCLTILDRDEKKNWSGTEVTSSFDMASCSISSKLARPVLNSNAAAFIARRRHVHAYPSCFDGRKKYYTRWLNRVSKDRFVPNLIREDGWKTQGTNSDFLKSCSGKFAGRSDGAHFTSQLCYLTQHTLLSEPNLPPFQLHFTASLYSP